MRQVRAGDHHEEQRPGRSPRCSRVIPICTRTASVTRTGATRAAGVTKCSLLVGVPHEQYAQRGAEPRSSPPGRAACRRRPPWPSQPALHGADEYQPAAEHRAPPSSTGSSNRLGRWNACGQQRQHHDRSTAVMNSKATTVAAMVAAARGRSRPGSSAISIAIAAAANPSTMISLPPCPVTSRCRTMRFCAGVDAQRELVRRQAAPADQQNPAGDSPPASRRRSAPARRRRRCPAARRGPACRHNAAYTVTVSAATCPGSRSAGYQPSEPHPEPRRRLVAGQLRDQRPPSAAAPAPASSSSVASESSSMIHNDIRSHPPDQPSTHPGSWRPVVFPLPRLARERARIWHAPPTTLSRSGKPDQAYQP